ncbi:hypothetical protein K1T34_42525 [Amycolatopsis sp. DSM 110486]|nr:hypothetical protein K1T34_42525 [Amycolatopsis sp. DSM 110486]
MTEAVGSDRFVVRSYRFSIDVRSRRRLFDTTSADDSDMAAPAITGLSKPSAASGSAAML